MISDEAFWGRVDASGDCWEWTAGRTGAGYGAWWVRDRQQLAHRWAWETLVGLVPVDRVLDHRCRVRHCVNPDHMEVVTQGANVRRSPKNNGVRCVHGHSLADAFVKPNGHLNCRTCVIDSTRRRRAALRVVA